MSFYLLTVLGIGVAIVFLVVRGEGGRLGPASAIALGIAGALNGALFTAAFRRGGWIAFAPLDLAGALLGAIGAIVALELLADAYVRRESQETGI